MKISAFGQSDIGKKREQNEDRILLDEGLELFVVCDGVGGHAAGEVAAENATQFVATYLHEKMVSFGSLVNDPARHFKILETVENAVHEACKSIYHAAKSDPKLAGMATTMTLLLIAGEKAVLAHVGDSRMYILRNNDVHLLTHDHTFANELISSGHLTIDDARKSKFSHMLMRTLGAHESVVVDTLLFDLFPGDTLLLCTDGLSNYFTDDSTVKKFLASEDVDLIPSKLVQFANSQGGLDNISAIAVRVDPESKPKVIDPIEVSRLLKALEETFLFNGLSLSRLMKLINICESINLNVGSTLINHNDSIFGFFLLLEGSLRIDSAPSQVPDFLNKGDHFGAESLTTSISSKWRISAESDCKILKIPGDEFQALTRRQPRLGRLLLYKLAEHLGAKLSNNFGLGPQHTIARVP